MIKKYREGPIGALMDEYERAAEELKTLLQTTDDKTYVQILDPITKDPDCLSIQTILNHVVRAGYGYANYIRIEFGDTYVDRKEYYEVGTIEAAYLEINKMLVYTEETLSNKWNISFEDVLRNIIKTRWDQQYDMDQLLEHAIVHILRHRRQIEKLLSKK